MHRRLARGVRGLAAGTVTTALALALHLAGGGAMPSTAAVLGSLGGAVWLAVLIGRARLSLPLLSAGVAAAQLLLHAIFSAATAEASMTGIGGDPHAGHAAGVLGVILHHGGNAMWWAHAVAGILTVAALHRGERVLLRLAALVAVVARDVLRFAQPVAGGRASRRPAAAPDHLLPLATRLLADAAARRGPPIAVVI